ncbi:esterase-like activity of phytase family protein [Mesobaculum littorinae]|uniref:esterase-like activity of phytase family protein n=1 Tax=Mesobaculum littorinae TaxID=2486419 RepID=UPI0038B2C60B
MTLKTALLTTAAMTLALPAGAESFNRIASFPVAQNLPEGIEPTQPTSAEIIDVSGDGMTLIYTDSPAGLVGMIDITDPAAPAPKGALDMGGEPTSVAVMDMSAFVGVNTSKSFTDPSGHLALIDMATGQEDDGVRCDLGGQPDSVAVAPDGSVVAIAIENERDEDLGDGRVGQMPAGYLSIVPLKDGMPDCDGQIRVDLTGLAEVGGDDPEPEFVDINDAGEIVVSLQENNHMVVVSSEGEILSDFSAGAVDLNGIDTTEDDALIFDESQTGRVREPDAVKWIDDDHFATANEGDMDGGSRGWTIFHKDGTVVYDSGTSFEHAIIEIGHYPEGRSENKGVEPESIETATFGDTPMVFVGSERASVVGVYDVTDPSAPVLSQLLPSGIGPEGYVAIPERNLLVSANENDLIEDGGARAHVMLFEYQDAEPTYPMLTSAGADELIGWGAISGMVADEDGTIYAVNDSFYAGQPTIFVIDPAQTPARITRAIRVTRDGAPAAHMDMEGITLDGDGGFWIANEGRTDRDIPHALYHVSAEGEITEEVTIPEELAQHEVRFGFEGVTMLDGALWMAVQREWGDDPENTVKLVAYTPETGEWGAVRYEKAAAQTGWVGLSEISAQGDWVYVVERDNQLGEAAKVKKVYRIAAADMQAAPLGSDLPVVVKEEVRDLIPDLTATGGYVLDKVEGLAVMSDGEIWVATDNDGVDDHSGETMFFSIGRADD